MGLDGRWEGSAASPHLQLLQPSMVTKLQPCRHCIGSIASAPTLPSSVPPRPSSPEGPTRLESQTCRSSRGAAAGSGSIPGRWHCISEQPAMTGISIDGAVVMFTCMLGLTARSTCGASGGRHTQAPSGCLLRQPGRQLAADGPHRLYQKRRAPFDAHSRPGSPCPPTSHALP